MSTTRVIIGALLCIGWSVAFGCEDTGDDFDDVSGGAGVVAGADGHGLKVVYFNNKDFTSQALERVDAVVDFDWGRGSPDSKVGSDTFSARWTGFVEAKYSETYTFYVVGDDGIRLYVDGKLVVNDWSNHGARERSGTIALKAGQLHAVKLEYYEDSGGATAKLLWSSRSQSKQIIPNAQLLLSESQDTGGSTGGQVSNLALGKPTSQSSVAYRGDSARAVDGNTSGRYGDNSVTHTNSESAPWWRVELGGSYRVDKVTLYNRTDCCGDRLSNFHVDYLDASGKVIAKRDYTGKAGAKTDIALSASGVYAVRVQLYGTNPLSLAEVQVFGAAGGGVSAGAKCVQVNENQTASLSCPSGDKITRIDFASYGLPEGSCDAGFKVGTCHASSSQSKVEATCLNRSSCTVAASNGVFGDPCGGKYKRLAVIYTCGGGSGAGDLCPSDPNKTAPGICGCGVSDRDSDGDGSADCKDACPSDRNKTQPGNCGCGVPEGTCGGGDDVTERPLHEAAGTKLRIGSWNNFRGSIFPKTSSLWRAINTSGKYHVTRTEGAARILEAVDADIWLMQETCYSSSGLPSGVTTDAVNREIASYMRSITGDTWNVRCNGRGLCTLIRGSIRFDGHWEKGTRVTGDRVILPDGSRALLMNVHYMNTGNASDTKAVIEDVQSTVSAVFVAGDFNDGPGGSRYNIIDGISGMNNLSMSHWKDPYADHLKSTLQSGKHTNTKGYMKWGEGASGEDLVTYIGGGHIDHFFLKSDTWRAGNRLTLNTLLFAPETLDLYGLEPLDIALQPQYYLKYFEDFLTDGIIHEIPATAYDAGDKLDHDHLPMIVDFTW